MFQLSKRTLFLIVFLFILGWLTSLILAVKISEPTKPNKEIQALKGDTSNYKRIDIEKLICKAVENPLKIREALRLYPYLLDGAYYIYYGHLILKGETFNNIETEAIEVLKSDIQKCCIELKRRKMQITFDNIFWCYTHKKN